MAKIRASMSSGGGGSVNPNIVKAYDRGAWLNGFSQNSFGFSGATFNADSISITGNYNGVYCQTDYSSTYSEVHITYKKTNSYVGGSAQYQYGRCTQSASLPTIMQSGAGRGLYYINQVGFYTVEQSAGISLDSGNGFFFGAFDDVEYDIEEIYFVKV